MVGALPIMRDMSGVLSPRETYKAGRARRSLLQLSTRPYHHQHTISVFFIALLVYLHLVATKAIVLLFASPQLKRWVSSLTPLSPWFSRLQGIEYTASRCQLPNKTLVRNLVANLGRNQAANLGRSLNTSQEVHLLNLNIRLSITKKSAKILRGLE